MKIILDGEPVVPVRGPITRFWFAIVGVMSLFAVTLVLDLGSPVNQDETWLWWVTHRVLSGDVLYRDVYCVTTPLSVWATSAAGALFGSQLVVVRAVVTAAFVAQVVLATSIVKRCGVARQGQILLVLALFVAGSPLVVNNALYTTLAILFAMVALFAAVMWHSGRDDARSRRPQLLLLGVAGAACGLSFGSKPNVGLLALAATLAAVALSPGSDVGRARARNLGVVASGCVIASSLTLVPVLVTGSWSSFVDQVFGGKRDYIAVGFSYGDALQRRSDALFGSGPHIDLLARWKIVLLLLPVACIAAAGFALWRARGAARWRALGFVAFLGVAVAAVYPRPGTNNFADTMPLALTATIAAVSASRPVRRAPRVAASYALSLTMVVTLVGLSAVSLHAIDGYSNAGLTRSSAAPFTGVAIPPKILTVAKQMGTELRTRTRGHVFIVRQDAAVLYFTTGLRDPLPYDYPQVSDFGGAGERGVIRRLASGAAQWVCLQNSPTPVLASANIEPRMIERWVRRHYQFVRRLPVCDLYTIHKSRKVAGTPIVAAGPVEPVSTSDDVESGDG